MADFGELIKDVEIMRIGTHTASSGQQVTFTDEDLSALAAAYDPAYSEAPVVIGHPAENGPAYGWVKSLRAVGGRLLATLDLVPEFLEAVRQGLFKKRSASIYHDLDGKGPYLRHVGFLGAMPPAVKALADINLADGQPASEFQFTDSPIHRLTEKKENAMSWKEKVKNLFTQAVDEIPEAGGQPTVVIAPPAPATSFSEDEVKAREQAAAEAAAKKAREEAYAEFAEKARQSQEAEAAKAHAAAVDAKIDALVQAGKVIPAQVKAGLVQFAASLPWRGSDQVDFADAGKLTPSEWFFRFLEALPPQVHFHEVAGRDQDVDADSREGLIRSFMERDKVGYQDAVLRAAKARPELFRY